MTGSSGSRWCEEERVKVQVQYRGRSRANRTSAQSCLPSFGVFCCTHCQAALGRDDSDSSSVRASRHQSGATPECQINIRFVCCTKITRDFHTRVMYQQIHQVKGIYQILAIYGIVLISCHNQRPMELPIGVFEVFVAVSVSPYSRSTRSPLRILAIVSTCWPLLL